MTTTLSIRLGQEQRDKLRRKARQLGKTESELVRDLVDREIDGPSRAEKLQKLKGALSFKDVKVEGWAKVIRERNWRS